MIDTKELRRLAQAASPGPWWVNQDGLNHGFERGVAEINSKEWHALAGARTINGAQHSEEGAANAEFIAAANPAAITELLERLEAAESARRDDYQNWMTALDRNAELLAKLEAAEKDIALKERIIDSLGSELNAVANERDAMRAMLRAALDVLEDVKGNINPERGYADELEADVERAIAVIVIPSAKGE